MKDHGIVAEVARLPARKKSVVLTGDRNDDVNRRMAELLRVPLHDRYDGTVKGAQRWTKPIKNTTGFDDWTLTLIAETPACIGH